VTNSGLEGTNSDGRAGDLDLIPPCVDSASMSSRRTVISAPLLFAIATAFGVSSTIQAYYLSVTTNEQMPDMLGHLLIMNTVYWYVPALMAPLVMRLALRYQAGRVGWPAMIGIHLGGALAYGVVHTAAMLAVRRSLMPSFPKGWWYAARVEFLTQLDWMFMTYLFLVGLAHAFAYRRESEARALDSAHLETRLIEAQLQSLQRQLHPHFLFNTLNTISGLMRTDVNAADVMMDRLGELLRATLSSSDVHEVTLREELELLQKYLDIEQTRFGARLTVRMHVHPEALEARVPNLLLQPLVENAVRHGIAPHARPGQIVVEATRAGARLRIQVRDSGEGVSPDRLTLLNQGVGLANTRARLQHLYRGNHEFVFSNADGGFSVTVAIPFVAERTSAVEATRMGAA
jgi:two-component system, LytTR family, sensor kinase